MIVRQRFSLFNLDSLFSSICRAIVLFMSLSLSTSWLFAEDQKFKPHEFDKNIKVLGGTIVLDGQTNITNSVTVGKYVELINVSTPTAPAANHARIFLNNNVPQVCAEFSSGVTSCMGGSSGGSSLTGVTAGTGLNGGGTSGTVTLNLTTPIDNSFLDSSSVTLQGNSFNSGTKLVQLSGGLIPNALIDSSSVTKQGNVFNGNSQLVQTNSSGQLPVLSGVNLTNFNASNLASGTIADTRLSSNVGLLTSTQTWSGFNTWTTPSISSFTYGVSVASMTIRSLSSGQCVQTGTGGLLTGTGSACTGSQAYFNNTQQCTVNTSSTTVINGSFIDTHLNCSITPTDSSHRIKVTVNGGRLATSTSAVVFATVKRGSTNLGGSNGFQEWDNNGSGGAPFTINYVDSPATTSATTYTVQMKGSAGTTAFCDSGVLCVLILEEIL